MSKLRQGSCIGILYKPPAGQCKQNQCQTYAGHCHCVHNGRFVGAVTKLGTMKIHLSKTMNLTLLSQYTGILIRHWNRPSPTSSAIFQEYLYIPNFRLENACVIPFAKLDHPVPIPPGNPCSQPKKGQTRKPHTIYPGDCVGIHFKKKNGSWDIKNGKYLFWERAGTHCTWNTTSNNHPDKVWYAHWVVKKKAPHFQSAAANRGPKSNQMETNISVHPITGYDPSEGQTISITFLNHTAKSRVVTYK